LVVPDINTLEWIQLFFTLDHALEQQEQTQTNKPKKKKAKNENLKTQKINPPTPKKGGAPSRLLPRCSLARTG
jgi:hypothetical protein